MLASRLYSPTLREIPAEAVVISHKYMLKAGMIRKIVGGIYVYMPLAWRTLQKIEAIIREEMNKAGSQEIQMPIIQPAEIWQQTGRWAVYGDEMFRLQDRHGRQYCLAPTHEEMITTLVHMDTNSYKQLPVSLYQIQNKYRDELRPRFGLMRGREFIMKDAYTFDKDAEGLDIQYRRMYDAYTNIFTRCGLHFRPVLADSGAIGGSTTHEFEALADSGEADIVYCRHCDFAANTEAVVPNTLPCDIKMIKRKNWWRRRASTRSKWSAITSGCRSNGRSKRWYINWTIRSCWQWSAAITKSMKCICRIFTARLWSAWLRKKIWSAAV